MNQRAPGQDTRATGCGSAPRLLTGHDTTFVQALYHGGQQATWLSSNEVTRGLEPLLPSSTA